METQNNEISRSANPRRRKRSRFQVFKESYLPVIIIGLTVICMLVFIIGSLTRGNASHNDPNAGAQTTDSTSATTESTDGKVDAEVASLLAQAAELAADFDYAGAMAVLESFSGDFAVNDKLAAAHREYTQLLSEMVQWQPSQVVNLSFHLLIADAERAFQDPKYGYDSYQKSYPLNFITTYEFSAILQQLYENDCMLVSLSDLYEKTFDASSGRWIYQEKTLLLPPGVTPVMITQTNANYYTYMVDSNGDGKPDAGADGFAYNLCYGENGFYNEIVLSDGTVSAGAYDIVPILEAFIAQHPDFSYRDARAIIAMSGEDGILGYHFNSNKLTEEERTAAKETATTVVQALRDHGYEIACFTYSNANYATKEAEYIKSDLQKWQENITAVVGEVDIMVLPKEGDIAGEESYDGNVKYHLMYDAGFTIYLGTGTEPWNQVDDRYVRHNRILVTGDYLNRYPQRFEGLFDAASVLDPDRETYR